MITTGTLVECFVLEIVSVKAKNLIETTYKSMMKAIEILKPGIKLGDIGYTIQSYVEEKWFFSRKRFLWSRDKYKFS